ncbi:thioredoxin [Armatimonas sp.]|uniref:thioredoxin n=1 Tax=Armatimonas sp. TaxID=1872638 RepID=UPI0037507D0F
MSSIFTADLKGIISPCPACGQKNRIPYERLAAAGTCGKCEANLPLVNAPVEIPSTAVFNAVIATSSLPVLVDFWAEWCGPCHAVAPVLDRIVEEQAGALKLVKVNIDEERELAARFGIASIPTMILFRDGEPSVSVVGAQPKGAIERTLGLTA